MENKTDDEQNPRIVLRQQGEEIKAKADELATFAADAARKATEYSDIADITILAAVHGSDLGDWETPIGDAVRLNKSIDGLLATRNQFYRLSPSSDSAGTIVASGVANLVSSQYYPFMLPAQVHEAQMVNVTIADLFDRHEYRQKALGLMGRFGLTGVIIRKFDAAWEAFLQSPQDTDVSISALIPLRSSINLIISELIRRRPAQRKVDKKFKIIEIGSQLYDDSVQPDSFNELNEEYGKLNDLLSGAKDAVLARARQEGLMRRGTLFIISLLGALDAGKLR